MYFRTLRWVGIRWYCTITLIGHLVVVCYLPERPPVEGEGGQVHSDMTQGVLLPRPSWLRSAPTFSAGRNNSVWQNGIDWGPWPPQPSYLSHFYPPSHRLLFARGSWRIKEILFECIFPLYIFLTEEWERKKWKVWWRPPLLRWLHDLSRDELVQKYLPTSWPRYWVVRYFGTSLT